MKTEETPAVGTKEWLKNCSPNEYLSFFAKFCDKTQATIAREVGFKTQSALSQILSTKKDKLQTKVPLACVWKLSRAIGCNPYVLRDKVFKERYPEYYVGEQKAGFYILSNAEKAVVEEMRKLQFREDLTEEDKTTIFKILQEQANKQA